MIRHLAVVLTIAWLAGCAATGSKLDPGATRAEVEKTMGKVTESLVGANGDTLLFFSRQPDGRADQVGSAPASGAHAECRPWASEARSRTTAAPSSATRRSLARMASRSACVGPPARRPVP